MRYCIGQTPHAVHPPPAGLKAAAGGTKPTAVGWKWFSINLTSALCRLFFALAGRKTTYKRIKVLQSMGLL
jgi:hypothetical protein